MSRAADAAAAHAPRVAERLADVVAVAVRQATGLGHDLHPFGPSGTHPPTLVQATACRRCGRGARVAVYASREEIGGLALEEVCPWTP